MRIDKYLHECGFAKSREAAKRMIDEGIIELDGRIVNKASVEVPESASVRVVGETLPYVSRGGLKLERALDVFGVDVRGLDCVDIGASTGGFTDCLLKRGAAHVRCVDVGRAQLDASLLNDERVTSFEGINARYLTPADIGGACHMAVCDVSFISLTLILPAVSSLLRENGRFIALIKPQFEAGRANIGKNGIVKDRNIHVEVIERVIDSAAEVGLHCFALTASPILGGDGNREYLAGFDAVGGLDPANIKKTVYDAR